MQWKEFLELLKMMEYPTLSPDLDPIRQNWIELENKMDRTVTGKSLPGVAEVRGEH